MAKAGLKVVEEKGQIAGGRGVPDEGRVERLVALGRALSDPIRVKMLGMMAEAAVSGRECCGLPDLGVPVRKQDAGICVCEFEDYFGMGQSKVSYHLRKLKDAGLIREERRGKWSFYSLHREAVQNLLDNLAGYTGTGILASLGQKRQV